MLRAVVALRLGEAEAAVGAVSAAIDALYIDRAGCGRDDLAITGMAPPRAKRASVRASVPLVSSVPLAPPCPSRLRASVRYRRDNARWHRQPPQTRHNYIGHNYIGPSHAASSNGPPITGGIAPQALSPRVGADSMGAVADIVLGHE